MLHFDGRCAGGETGLNYFGITEKTFTEAGVKLPLSYERSSLLNKSHRWHTDLDKPSGAA